MSMSVNTQAHGLCEGALCDKARYIERGSGSSNLVVGPLAHDAHRLKLRCLSASEFRICLMWIECKLVCAVECSRSFTCSPPTLAPKLPTR